jgi:diguanylate cyclase (GGDEF)-like protein
MSVGIAEIFITPDRTGGALNSSLVAIGLTEDESAEDEFRSHIEFEDDSEEVSEGEEFIPFMDRILNLLERTSEELTSLNTELGEIAYTDRLTRVYNRWELENKLTDVLKMDVANDTNSSLVFMDIDHFKRVNDNYGHDVGDLVLRATVQVIKDNLESSYVFGRWGGEEFICILPETGLEEAAVFAEKLRKAIESNCFVAVQHITMSFGVTSSKPADDSESFVKRADEALYEAKETGRNKVVTRE